MNQVDYFPLDKINAEDRSFCASWGRSIEILRSSIQAAGQTSPVILRRAAASGRCQIVHGFRRMEALKSLGKDQVKAVVLEGEDASDRRAFEIMFWENLTTRGFNPVEAAMAARAAAYAARMDEAEILSTYLPAMGFERSRKILDRLTGILDLEPQWLDWIAQKDVSLKTAGLIRKVSAEDRTALLALFKSIRPGQNIVRELIPLLSEIAARESSTISELLNEQEFKKLSDPERADRNQRQSEVMQYLRRRKGKERERIVSAMDELRRSLDLPSGVSLKKPSRLAPLSLVFQVEADSGEELERGSRALADASRSESLKKFFGQWG
jgi:ParB/RepB/Spo0J family partition protein